MRWKDPKLAALRRVRSRITMELGRRGEGRGRGGEGRAGQRTGSEGEQEEVKEVRKTNSSLFLGNKVYPLTPLPRPQQTTTMM